MLKFKGYRLIDETGITQYLRAFSVKGLGFFDYLNGKKIDQLINSIPGIDKTSVNKLIKLLEKKKSPFKREEQKTYLQFVSVDAPSPIPNYDNGRREVKNNIGMLIAPYIELTWGGKKVDPKWYRDLEFGLGTNESPGGLSFKLDSMAPFSELPLKKGGEGAEIKLKLGYSDRRYIELNFIHTGTAIQSGNDMSVGIEASNNSFKGDQTPQRNKNFVAKNEPITLMDNFKNVAQTSKLRLADETDFKYSMWTSSQAETDMAYILRLSQAYGLTVYYPFDKKTDLLLRPADTTKWVNGVKQPKAEGKVENQEVYVYYLGPGVVNTIERRINAQKLSAPSDEKASESNPQVKVKKPTAKDVINQVISGRIGDLVNGISKPGSSEPVGPAADPNMPKLASKSMDSKDKDTTQEKKIEENKIADTEAGQIELSTTVLMVPRFVGIKPSDFIVVMALEENKLKYQDYLVEEVNYTQTGNMFHIAIQAKRWLKDTPMMPKEDWDKTLADIKKRGLLGDNRDHTSQLFTGNAYPVYNSFISYYWGRL